MLTDDWGQTADHRQSGPRPQTFEWGIDLKHQTITAVCAEAGTLMLLLDALESNYINITFAMEIFLNVLQFIQTLTFVPAENLGPVVHSVYMCWTEELHIERTWTPVLHGATTLISVMYCSYLNDSEAGRVIHQRKHLKWLITLVFTFNRTCYLLYHHYSTDNCDIMTAGR